MPKPVPIFALLFATAFAATVGSIVSTDKKIGRYFGMRSYIGVVPEHVRTAVLEHVPLGSSRDQVERALAALSIGIDEYSTCQSGKGRRNLTCELGVNHHPWEILRRTYTISFAFNPEGVLRDVFVTSRISWI